MKGKRRVYPTIPIGSRVSLGERTGIVLEIDILDGVHGPEPWATVEWDEGSEPGGLTALFAQLQGRPEPRASSVRTDLLREVG